MIKLLKSKKGIGIPTVLGIVTFVLATLTTLLTVALSQAKLMDRSIETSEAYANAVQAVDATLKIIVRDENVDPAYLDALEAYMGVTIEVYGTSIYMISSMVTATKSVTSYLTSADLSTFDDLLGSTGQVTDFVLSPLVTPTTLLASYLPVFIENTFPNITPQTEFTTFQSIITYVRSLAFAGQSYSRKTTLFLTNNPTVSGHWYIDGSVTLSNNVNLTVPSGYLLFIDGNLTMSRGSTITGNVVIDGTLTLNSNSNSTTQYIKGTVYVRSNVYTTRKLGLGTSARPAFVFAEGNITFTNNVNGYGYFLCDTFDGDSNNAYITGGVYTSVRAYISRNGITAQTNLNVANFYSYAIPDSIGVSSGGTDDSPFFYTFPRLT